MAGSPCALRVEHAGGPPTSGPAGTRTTGKRDILLLGWEPWECRLVASLSPQRAVILPRRETSMGGGRAERRGPENVRGHCVSPWIQSGLKVRSLPTFSCRHVPPLSPALTRVDFVAGGGVRWGQRPAAMAGSSASSAPHGCPNRCQVSAPFGNRSVGRFMARGPCAGAELTAGLGRMARGHVQPLPSEHVLPRAVVTESAVRGS